MTIPKFNIGDKVRIIKRTRKEYFVKYHHKYGWQLDCRQVGGSFTCKYCGMPSWIDPSDQSPPPGYCHEIDHGTAEDRAVWA